MTCFRSDYERALLSFLLLPLSGCLLLLSLFLSKLTLEANAQVRSLQEFAQVASVLALYFSFVCMLDIILALACVAALGNGIWHAYLHTQSEK